MSPVDLRALCAAAGLEVPEDDLPLLAEALANHLEAVERLRCVDVSGIEIPAAFDARWS
jgi:hypothetical protein